ncbi:MAG: TlpA disulfide reductase family protein [Acidobacteriota bacterium]
MASKGKNRGVQPATRFWTPTRIGMTGAVVILLALVASTLFRTATVSPVASTKPTTVRPPSRPGPLTALRPEAMDSTIELIAGDPVRLSDYAGKVLVVDLWATWCGPCRIEIPYLKDLAKEFKGKGLEVLGLTTEDKATDSEAVKNFVKQFKINYPIGWANRDIAMDVMQGRGAIPQTLVIGKDGKVKKHLVGFNIQVSAPQLRKAVEDAMAE